MLCQGEPSISAFCLTFGEGELPFVSDAIKGLVGKALQRTVEGHNSLRPLGFLSLPRVKVRSGRGKEDQQRAQEKGVKIHLLREKGPFFFFQAFSSYQLLLWTLLLTLSSTPS